MVLSTCAKYTRLALKLNLARVTKKEGARLMHLVRAGEIQIAPIHDVERPGFRGQDVRHIDVFHLVVTSVNETGDGATQVEQRVQLDGRFGCSKWRPIKQAQAQVDSAAIQCITLLAMFTSSPNGSIGI